MSPQSYLDFDLLIESSGKDYRAAVVNSPAGQAAHTFSLPFSERDLEILVLQVFKLASRRSVRSVGAPEMTDVRSFGGHLFETLFAGDVNTCLLRSMDEADRTHHGLRVRLRLGNAPRLANIPWEFLYDSSSGGFLCLSAETPLVRYVDLPQRVEPLAAKAPLHMLCLISSPAGYPPLDVQHEWAKLNEALGPTVDEGRLVVEKLETPSLQALQRRLRRGSYHILHFIGHGAFDERSEDGVLLLEDLEGKGHPVSGESLGVLLHDHESLRLVVLNSCEGARTSPTDPFAGTAQSLVRKGIPAVIAMQFEISDVAAITLASEFYSAVSDGLPVDGALSEARKAVFTQVNAVEWATPVLYMRSPDGRIFEIEDQDERLATREIRKIVAEPSPLPGLPVEIPDRAVPPLPVPMVEPEPRPEPELEVPEPEPEPAPPPKPEPVRPVPPKPVPPKPTPRPDLVRKLALLAGVLVLAVVAFFVVKALTGGDGTDGGGNGNLVVVPATAGLEAAAATEELEGLGFSVELVDAPSRNVAPGLVIRTIPAANAEAPRGSNIAAHVSSGSWIAFVFEDAGDSEIFVMRPDGSRRINLTNHPAFDRWPAWSPDGSKIAFASSRNDPNPTTCAQSCNDDIFVMNADGSGVRQLTDTSWTEGAPTWSPDGSRIAFHSNEADPGCHASDKCDFNIYVVNTDGKGLKQLTGSLAPDETPRWSPAGDAIAFRSRRDGNYEIYAMNPDGEDERNLTREGSDDAGPTWSPDGTRIAFRRISGVHFDIWVMSSDGSDQSQLPSGEPREIQPAWSPDGKRIAFLIGQPGNRIVAVMNADGTGDRETLTSPGDYEQPAW